MYEPEPDHIRRCPGCNDVLPARQNAYNWSTQRFCSEECRDRYLTMSNLNRCPECDGPLYARGEVRSKGRPKRFCSSTCKTRFNTRRESRALELYDLVMGRRNDTDHHLHRQLDATIRRLRDGWHREDHPKERPAKRTWYDWERYVPADLKAKARQEAEEAARPPDPYQSAPPQFAHIAEWRHWRREAMATEAPSEPRPIEQFVPPRPLRLKGVVGPTSKDPVIVQKRNRSPKP